MVLSFNIIIFMQSVDYEVSKLTKKNISFHLLILKFIAS